MFFGGGFPSQTVYNQNNARRRTRFYYQNQAAHNQENPNQAEANNVTVALQGNYKIPYSPCPICVVTVDRISTNQLSVV